MRFSNKVCLITGAGSGIGKATAIQMAAEGGQVAIIDNNAESGKIVADTIESAGGEAIFIHTDVSQEAQVRASVEATIARWGHIDIVVNDAAVMTFDKLVDLSTEQWDWVMNVNLRSVFLYTKFCVPYMRPGSSFVNISSVHAHKTTPNVIPYASTKGAIEAFIRGACQEYSSNGIRFNCVAPGAVDTPMLWSNPNLENGSEQLTGAIGQPRELAAAVCFIASGEASFVNGAVLIVDGGRLDAL